MNDADKKMIALGQAREVTSVWMDEDGNDAITETIIAPPVPPADADWKERGGAVALWQARRNELLAEQHAAEAARLAEQKAARNKAQGGGRSAVTAAAVAYSIELHAQGRSWQVADYMAHQRFGPKPNSIRNKRAKMKKCLELP